MFSKAVLLSLFCTLCAFAQLPTWVIGGGEEWSRGSSSRFGTDVTVADLISNTKFYLYGNIFTPDHKGVAGQPTSSVLTAGGAYAAVVSGRVTLLFIFQAGFNLATAASPAVPAFSGSVGTPIALGSGWSVMPFLKGLATTAAPTLTGGGVNTVIQLGMEVQKDLWSTAPAVTPACKPVTARMRRKVFKWAGLTYPNK